MATLVLKKWRLTKVATTTEAMQIEIVGRSSGFISWLLTLCGIDPTTSLFASDEGITFKSTSLAGADLRFIPFDSLSSVSWEIYKPWKTALLILFVAAVIGMGFAGAFIHLTTGIPTTSPILAPVSFLIGTALAVAIALVYYKLNRQLAIGFTEIAGPQHGIRFKRSVIENVNVNQEQAEEAYKIIRRLMTISRAQHIRGEAQHVEAPQESTISKNTQGFSPPPIQNSNLTPTPASPATPSIEDHEALAMELYLEAKKHLASGAKNSAIGLLREIVRLYPYTRMAEKARASLKDR